MTLKQNIHHLARQAGGSHKTVHDRVRIMGCFQTYLKHANIQIKQIDQLKSKHIQGYIKSRLAEGISKRTLQNEMAAVRSVLKQAGRSKLASSAQISNRQLGIGDASRQGAKTAMNTAHLEQIIQTAYHKNPSIAVALQLCRQLGLRSEEVVRSSASFKTWQQALARGDKQLHVIYGTKGGRPRMVTVINREALQSVLNQAINIANTQNDRLINKPDLKTAMNYWHNQVRALGLTGKQSPHSLRYAWAQDAIHYYQEQGYSRKEAEALTSMDLGHGDGRGRYVARVYGL